MSSTNFECHKCGLILSTKYKLNDHLKRKIPCTQQTTIFCCQKCGKQFTRKYNMQRHIDKNKCTAYQIPQTSHIYIQLLTQLTDELSFPIKDCNLIPIWNSTCLQIHNTPHNGFDILWKLLSVLTITQLTHVLQLHENEVPIPPGLPNIINNITLHLQKLLNLGNKHLGKNKIIDIIDSLPLLKN